MALHYVIRAEERASFLRCRRAWNFGSRERRSLEPTGPSAAVDLQRTLLEALAVYYFPGMWDWQPAIVLPLVRKALTDSLRDQQIEYLAAHGLATLPPEQVELTAHRHEQASAMLEAYIGWAPTADAFSPIGVVVEADTTVPDHRAPHRDIVSPDGRTVRFRDRVHGLVIDEHNNYWIMEHRLVHGAWPDVETVMLDDRCLAWCWVWQREYGGMRIEGTIYNELQVGTPAAAAAPPGPRGSVSQTDTYIRPWAPVQDPQVLDTPAIPARPVYERRVQQGEHFRRIQVPRSREEISTFGARLSAQVLDMIDPNVLIYPNPAPAHCGPCEFRQPCIATNAGGDVESMLADRYKPRETDGPQAGRLGAVAPNRGGGALSTFGQRRR
jgi:hypothetical protein